MFKLSPNAHQEHKQLLPSPVLIWVLADVLILICEQQCATSQNREQFEKDVLICLVNLV